MHRTGSLRLSLAVEMRGLNQRGMPMIGGFGTTATHSIAFGRGSSLYERIRL